MTTIKLAVAAVLVSLLGWAVACGDDEATLTLSPTPSNQNRTLSPSPASPSALDDLKPADSQSPTAGVCLGPSATTAQTIEFRPDVPSPRCVRVLTTTRLRLVNQTEEPVDFEFGAFRGSLTSGGEAVSDLPVGEFLAAGVHVIQSTAYGPGSGTFGGSGEVWVLTEEMAESVELVIHRADGTDQILHLLSRPIVCGRMGEIIELCGEQIVDGQMIAVDFIQVNLGLGETYEVRER